MKRNFSLQLLLALLVGAARLNVKADIFFSDTFTNGSTINSGSPADPTATNTAYQMLSNKNQVPPPTVGANDLVFGIASSSSAVMEIQALFATNPIALVLQGDNMQLAIVFTNRAGILTPTPATSQLGIGLFNSGNVAPFNPLPGGTNLSTGLALANYTQKWQGYVGQIVTGASKIMTRPSQAAAADGWNQELVLSGSSTATARNQANIGSATNTAVTLTTGATYTEVLSITMNDANSLAITNTLYSGAGTGGTVVVSSGGIATNTTFLTGGFNGFGFGYQTKVAGPSNTIDVASIQVTGSVTPVSGPPTIVQQPVNVTVPSGGSCAFSVVATGYSVTYQWKRNGTNLLNGGNISGATSSQLVISPAGSADVLSGANGYYVVVTGAGPFSTNSEIHSLSLGAAQNLIYSGSGAWDLNTSPSWAGGLTFNYGDAVTFDDTGAGGIVPLVGSYLSASSVTVNANFNYTFNGLGSFAGPGKLIYTGANQLTINNPNTYSGGTLVSNATANLRLGNQTVLGTGPVTLAKAGGQLDLLDVGSASAGLGDVIVQDDFKIIFEKPGTFATVILGNLSGITGKTLLINPSSAAVGTTNRIRVYGTNTVCNANLVINDGSNGDPANSLTLYSGSTFAPYNPSGSQTYNGVISGVGGLVQRGSGLTVLNAQSTYSGGTYTTAGGIAFGVDSTPTVGTVTSGPIGVGPLYVSPEVNSGNGSGTVQAANGARTIANPIQYPTATNNQTLIFGGTNALTLTGSYALNGQDGSATAVVRTVQVNNTNSVATLTGVISDGGMACGLTKTGLGALALNNTETYTGPTLISAGILAVNGALNAASVVTVTNGLLGGTGTVNGAVTIQTGGGVAPGNSIGTLTINNNLTIQGGSTNRFEVNKGAGTKDLVVVNGNATYNGTLSVTNLSGTITTADTFQIFNVSGTKTTTFTNIIGSPGAGLAWSFTNSTGILGVVATVNPNPTNMTAVVNNGKLELSWPADHTGWHLQAQTNSLSIGLLTNAASWVTIPNTETSNSYTNTINPANGTVFYRMVYP